MGGEDGRQLVHPSTRARALIVGPGGLPKPQPVCEPQFRKGGGVAQEGWMQNGLMIPPTTG